MAISKSGLPQKVLELFDPREDLAYLPPIVHKKASLPMLGIAPFVGHFPGPEDPSYAPAKSATGQLEDRKFRCKEFDAQVSIELPSITERREVKAEAGKVVQAARLEAALAAYDPKADAAAASDPMKTLFVSRIDFEVDEAELTTHFSEFGPIAVLRIVRDSAGKSRGYGFVEYEHTGDMKSAYKALPNGKKVRGRRLCVDVERGRTVPDWKPMRLGGGKGGESRVAREKRNKGDKSQMPPPGMGMMDRGGMDRGPPPRDTRAPMRDDRDSRPPRDTRPPREDRAPSYDRSRPPRESGGGLPPPPRGEERGSDRRSSHAPRDERDDRDRRSSRDERGGGRDERDRRDRDPRDGDRDGKRDRRDDDRDRDYKRPRRDEGRSSRY